MFIINNKKKLYPIKIKDQSRLIKNSDNEYIFAVNYCVSHTQTRD